MSGDDHDLLIRKLESVADISLGERQALGELILNSKTFPASREIVSEGDKPTHCCLVLEGFIHRYKTLSNGTRQVMSYHIRGDLPDLQSLHFGRMDHSLGTVTACRLAFIPHGVVHDLIARQPGIGSAFWRDTLNDAAIFREWIVNVGARSAPSQIAHLICELYVRLRAVDLASGDGFTLPFTQAEIGQATGNSSVHVNRSLQELRAENLIASDGRFVRILNWPRLQAKAGFDPNYLHLSSSQGELAA